MADKLRIKLTDENKQVKMNLNIPLGSLQTLRDILGDEATEKAKEGGMDLDGWIDRLGKVDAKNLFEMQCEGESFTVDLE